MGRRLLSEVGFRSDQTRLTHYPERHLKSLLRQLGLPAVRFDDLRHAFASLMLSKGVRVDLVSQMLGHSKPAMTLNVYAHLMPGDDTAALAALHRALGAGQWVR